MRQHELAALHLDALEPAQEAHAEQVGAKQAVEHDGRHARSRSRSVVRGEIETARRKPPQPLRVVIGERHERRAGIGHEGRAAVVDRGIEHEMPAPVGSEPHLAGKARPLLFARLEHADVLPRALPAKSERASQIVE